MALEDLTGLSKYIDALNRNNPDGSLDGKNQGDDHIRGFKNVLLNTFPNISGPVTKTHTQINNADDWASGTLALFQQSAAPNGWTKQTTHNDKALRVVSGTVGSGGSSAFSTVFGKTAVDSHILSVAEMPAHNHGGGSHQHKTQSYNSFNTGGTLSAGIAYNGGSLVTAAIFDMTASGTIITTQGSGNGHIHNMDIRVQYVDIIIASKD